MRARIGRLLSLLFVAAVAALAVSLPAQARSCEALSSLKLTNAVITSASTVGIRQFSVPRGPGADMQGPYDHRAGSAKLPAFCRVQITVQPAIKIEVWMPASDWNGKFEAVGNGGKAGSISYAAWRLPFGPDMQRPARIQGTKAAAAILNGHSVSRG
jgi:feruloyl esterase